MKDQTLYETPGPIPYMTMKKVSDRNFYYAERLGVDSVAFVLINKDEKLGLLREAKPPFNDREEINGNMHFKTTAFGGSLFDMVDTEQYLKMSHNQQLKICEEVVIKECEEEAGYKVTRDDLIFANKVVFDSMSNSYTWLFVVLVRDEYKCKPDPQNEIEAIATIQWIEVDENGPIKDLECGKTPSIMFYAGFKPEFEEKLIKILED